MADLDFTILDDSCFSSQLQYTAAGKENLQNYNLVTDTPLYVTAVQSGINASEVRLSCLLFPNQHHLSLHILQQKRITDLFVSVGEIQRKLSSE